MNQILYQSINASESFKDRSEDDPESSNESFQSESLSYSEDSKRQREHRVVRFSEVKENENKPQPSLSLKDLFLQNTHKSLRKKKTASEIK